MICGEPEARGAKRGGKHSLPAVELPSRSVAELCETAECWRSVFACCDCALDLAATDWLLSLLIEERSRG
jgi:hypothetical protein